MNRARILPFSLATFSLLAVFVLSSCGGGSQPARDFSFNPAFSSYISEFTSETISRTSPIIVRLNTDAVTAEQVDAVLDASPVDFAPDIAGTARWIDTRTLEFKPEKPLPSGKLYQGSMALGPYFEDVPEDMQEFRFQFETRKQGYEINVKGTQTIDNTKLEWQAIDGEVNTADFEEPELVEQILSAKQKGKALKVKWNHSLDGMNHGFRVDSIRRSTDQSAVKLVWSGSAIDVDVKGDQEVTIPALGDFKVLRADAYTVPEQYVLITFSDPLMKKQDFKGLVKLQGYGLRYSVEGNTLKAYPRSAVTGSRKLEIFPGIKNILGHKVQGESSYELVFEEKKPEVRLVNTGVILPRTGSALPFAFEAVSLKSVKVTVKRIFENNVLQFLQVNALDGNSELHRVGTEVYTGTVPLDKDKNINLGQWNRHVLDLAKLVDPEPGAIYNVEIDFRGPNSSYTCATAVEDDGKVKDPEAEDSYWDNYEEDDWYSRYQNRDNPCHPAYYTYNSRAVSRNVLASDLGLMVKQGTDGSLNIAATDLKTTEPLSGINLELYDFTQQLLKKLTTDGDGLASAKLEEKPFFLVAKKGNQRGYVKLDDGYSLSMSKFDVSGQRYFKGVKGFIYGERGVWRPGDSLYLTFILEDKNVSLPAEHPVTFTLFDPRGQEVEKKSTKNHVNGFYPFMTSTGAEAPTGNYRLNVKVGGASFNKDLKIETVVPNRLKISLDFGKEYLAKEDQNVEGKLSSRWLHGALASNLSAKVKVNLSSTTTRFKTYTDYYFDDPVRRFEPESSTIFDGNLDEEGNAQVKVNLDVRDEAPGMLRANFSTQVFEPGGNFSSDRFSTDYYPYERFVGIKLPKGDKSRGMLLTDKQHKIDVVMVNAEGKATGSGEVEMGLYKLDWKWWWDQGSNNISNYSNKFYNKELKKEKIKITNGIGQWNMEVKYPEWGRFLVRACDGEGHCTGKIVYIDWPNWAGRGQKDNPGGASMLTFNAEKTKYNTGEEIKLNIPTANKGRAFISIESESRILKTAWVDANAGGMTTWSFTATEEMAPNIYAHVSLLQPHAQTANDLPLRLYGVVPIEVVNPATLLNPEIKMPDVLRPMEKVSIKVAESNGKPMTYTLAVVDEGLLGLTRFQTPDPWNTFYAREALEVKTWDLFDNVVGAFGGELGKLLAIGGDDDGTRPKEGTKVNRFRPVVKYIGPFYLPPGENRTHTFTMPNYIGEVRTMVVAGHQGAYGNAEKSTPVRKPLMVLGSLPRVLGPSEEVRLPITVFAMEDNIKNVELSLEASDIFTVQGPIKSKMTFSKPGDDMSFFDLKVKSRVGKGSVKVTARSGSETAIYDIDIEVRAPNPRVTNVETALIDPGKSWTKDFYYPGMAGTNNGVLEVSSIPPLNLGERLQYLIRYPHGCIEQTTSSVFPQIYLTDLLRLDEQRKFQIKNNINAGIDRLKLFQVQNGGLSYWPGGNEADDWGSNYGGNFLVHAKLAGYNVPSNMLSNWMNFQSKRARDWGGAQGTFNEIHGDVYHKEFLQADRLYLLALAGKPELGAMNRLRETKNLKTVTKWRLAAAYHLAGQPEAANKLVRDLAMTVSPYKELGNTRGDDLRDKAIILECLSMMQKTKSGVPIIKQISDALSKKGNWMSTQTTGYCLTAMGVITHKAGPDKGVKFSWKSKGGNWADVDDVKPIAQVDLNKVSGTTGQIEFKNNGSGPLYVRVITDGIPEQGDLDASQNVISMSINYMDMEGNSLDPTNLEQGTDFMAEVKINNPGSRGFLDEMALTQIFPSGWEIHNTRMDGTTFSSSVSVPEYQDIRDDRVYTYFDLADPNKRYYGRTKPESKKTFRILLNASYLGKFYLPTVYAEAMYDREISARIPGRWVEVTEKAGM